MKFAWTMLLGLAVVLAFVVTSSADDGKEVTLKGTITCAKCDLKQTDKCATVIKVKEDGKEVVYFFDKASDKKNHKSICNEPKEGTVKGTVSEKDGKKTVKATKVEFN